MAIVLVDVRDATVALASLARKLPVATGEALSTESRKIEQKARTRHRYRERSGTLERATLAEATREDITAYIDDAMAPYGEYVHDGRKGWAPDQFVYKAMNESEDNIRRSIEHAFDQSISSQGLG